MINKVILMGRLGKDPELRDAGSSKVVKFTLATSERVNKETELTEWHNVEFWAEKAEIIARYAKKGSLLYIEGKIRTEKWQDKEGNDRYTTKIRGSEFSFISTGNANSNNNSNNNNNDQQASERSTPQFDNSPALDDDLPF